MCIRDRVVSAQDPPQPKPDFQSLIALFYPSVTGIMAGSNRSGVLATPSKSIPLGTLAAIALTTFLYVVVVWLYGLVVAHDVLIEEKLVVALVAWPSPIIVKLGIIMSCVGAALQSLTGAPRLLAAIASDGALPVLSAFAPPSDAPKQKPAAPPPAEERLEGESGVQLLPKVSSGSRLSSLLPQFQKPAGADVEAAQAAAEKALASLPDGVRVQNLDLDGNASTAPTVTQTNVGEVVVDGSMVSTNDGADAESSDTEGHHHLNFPHSYPGTEGCQATCEGHAFTQEECKALFFCEWDQGACFSAVGPKPCPNTPQEKSMRWYDYDSDADTSTPLALATALSASSKKPLRSSSSSGRSWSFAAATPSVCAPANSTSTTSESELAFGGGAAAASASTGGGAGVRWGCSGVSVSGRSASPCSRIVALCLRIGGSAGVAGTSGARAFA